MLQQPYLLHGQSLLLQTISEYLIAHFTDYPYNEQRDQTYFNLLFTEFPDIDIFEELKAYHIWTLDFPLQNTSHRTKFRRWLKKAIEIKATNSQQTNLFTR